MKRPAIITFMLALGLVLAGCSGYNQANGQGDAAIEKSDNSGAEIINFPDTYGNIATKCAKPGFRVFSTTHGSSDDKTEYASQIWVMPDPLCK